MAGKIKNAGAATGRMLLELLALLVLAFWIGGGLVVGGLTTYFLDRVFTEKQLPDKAGEIAGSILSSFATTEVIAGGALCVLLFIFERKSRKGRLLLAGFVLLVILTAANQFIISGLQGYGIHSTVYQAIFFAQIGLALIFLAVFALAGRAAPVPVVAVLPAAVPVAPPPPLPLAFQPAAPVHLPPAPPRPEVSRPGAGEPPFAFPSNEAMPSAPAKPSSLPDDIPRVGDILGDEDRKVSGGREERS